MKRQYLIAGTMMGALMALLSSVGLGGQLPPAPSAAQQHRMGFSPGMDVQFAFKLVKGAPFSAQAITEENQTLSDGNQINRTATSALYRDSAGRTRREETLGSLGPWAGPQGNANPVVLINDPVAGVNYTLNPATHLAQKMQPPRQGVNMKNVPGSGEGAPPPPPGMGGPGGGMGARTTERRELAAEGGTVEKESLGSQVIAGVQAEGTRTTITIPAGSIGNVKTIQIVTERWYSPALQVVVMSKRSDPRVGETTYRLTNINQAEPAAALFQIPGDYTIQDAPALREFRGRR
ncbi:MAG: hypothetical protein ABSB82_01885 [Terriglobia bacterium]